MLLRLYRVRWCAIVAGAACLVAGAGCGGDDGDETAPPKRSCEPGAPYGKGNWPPAPCWRPYHDKSAFNDPVGTVVREYPNSVAMIQRLLTDMSRHPGNLVVRVDGHTGEPTYYSQDSDPEYTLKCTMVRWGECPFGTDTKIHIPLGAVVEGNTLAQVTNSEAYLQEPDAHLTIVDQASGWEYDLWQVHRSPINPGDGAELTFSWGGRTLIDGDGIAASGKATAAQFGSLAGRIRAEELVAKKIDHALAIVIPCDNGDFMWPGGGHGRKCQDTTNAIPMGARLHLEVPEQVLADLRAKGVPEWKLAILDALRTYGAYVNDTGTSSWFTFEQEAGSQYTVVGDADAWLAMASTNGGWFRKAANQEPTFPAEHWVGIMRTDAGPAGVNWVTDVWAHLRVVFPRYPERIKIRADDAYRPLTALVAEPSQGVLEAEVTDASAAPIERAVTNRDQVISLFAQGRDGESGVKAIEIWTEMTTWTRPPGSNVDTQHGPGLSGAPLAANSDADSHAVGETVESSRITVGQIKFADVTPGTVAARVAIWATTRNYRGETTNTQQIVYRWTCPPAACP